MFIDATNLNGHSISEPLLYDETKFDKIVKLEDILITLENNDIGCFVEVDLTWPDNTN